MRRPSAERGACTCWTWVSRFGSWTWPGTSSGSAAAKPEGQPIEFVGLRPGEKLHEELFYANEDVTATDVPKVVRSTITQAMPRTLHADLDTPILSREYRDEQLRGELRSFLAKTEGSGAKTVTGQAGEQGPAPGGHEWTLSPGRPGAGGVHRQRPLTLAGAPQAASEHERSPRRRQGRESAQPSVRRPLAGCGKR